MMNRVLAGPKALPGFWVFMYYVSPFTYLVDGMLSTGLANTEVKCSSIEFRILDPPKGKTCGKYLSNYPTANVSSDTFDSTQNCSVCPQRYTNDYLRLLSLDYSHRWRNFGIMWGYIIFNICAALFFYWLARVPKKQKILDTPPTEQVSRAPTRASKPEVDRVKKVKGGREVKGAAKEEPVGEVDGWIEMRNLDEHTRG